MRAQNITWIKEGARLLDACSFQAETGDFWGILGPNGAGKSSLLKVLSGIQIPTEGNVFVGDGHEIPLHALKDEKRAQMLGYLAQQEKAAWPMSVEDLILLGRLPWRDELERESLEEKLLAVLVKTEILHLRQRVVSQLSGGEMQRVLIARVLIGEPDIILADEPIAALDIYHQLQVMEQLQNFASSGKTVVAALHDLSLAARYCNKLLLLNNGRIVAQGAPIEVLTEKNIAEVYKIEVYVECREDSVIIFPRARLNKT